MAKDGVPPDDKSPACEPTDLKASVVKLMLGVMIKPVTKICSNEVSFLLVVIIGLGGWGVYWGVSELRKFATEQIPQHIDAINKGTKEVSVQFSEDLKAQRESYLELRTLDEKNIDRIERLATGKKVTTVPPAP